MICTSVVYDFYVVAAAACSTSKAGQDELSNLLLGHEDIVPRSQVQCDVDVADRSVSPDVVARLVEGRDVA